MKLAAFVERVPEGEGKLRVRERTVNPQEYVIWLRNPTLSALRRWRRVRTRERNVNQIAELFLRC